MRLWLSLLVLLFVFAAPNVWAQTDSQLDWSVDVYRQVRLVPNVVYTRANSWEGRLDIYARIGERPVPTVIYIHGGGWMRSSKEANALNALPYLSMGFAVVNVGYRLGDVSPAPAAVEDCRCALRWVIEHAKEYNFDVNRLVVAGSSAGGHLALMTAMAPADAGFDRSCLSATVPKVAAVVNFYGITDVAELLDGPGKKPYPERWPYATHWLGNAPQREDLARRVSPLTYVRTGVPPVITVHGDADDTVPYTHAVRLHDALKKVGVANNLVTIPKGGHAQFPPPEWRRGFAEIHAFLVKHGLAESPSGGEVR